jgi:multidrug efflux pump subunit AcrB
MTASEPKLGISGRTAGAFLHSQLTPLIALLLLLLGLFAVLVTPKEEEPQINVTMANVIIPFPGASSEDVHNMVTVPAEQVLSQITGIEHIYSVTQPGMAILTVQYKVGQPRIDSLVKLYDTLMSNRDWLPTHLGVMEPVVKPKGIDDVPIVTLALHSKRPDVSAADLQHVAHELEIELKRVAGTREVTTLGGPGNVVRVTLDPERMNAHHITVTDIERALRATNASLPVGQLTTGNRSVRSVPASSCAAPPTSGNWWWAWPARPANGDRSCSRMSRASRTVRTLPPSMSGTVRARTAARRRPSPSGRRSRSRCRRSPARTLHRWPTR